MALKQKTCSLHLGRFSILLASTALLITSLVSCSLFESDIAVLWTDSPEIQLAAELFNASQTQYLIELHYRDNLETALAQAKIPPSLVIGKNLRQPATMARFQTLDFLFDRLAFSRNDFYPALLEAGTAKGKTLLIPVSFNTLMLVNKKGALDSFQDTAGETGIPVAPDAGNTANLAAMSNSTITIDEIRTIAGKFNKDSGKGFTAMGFVPRKTGGDFLFQWVQWMGADFSSQTKPDKGSLPIQWDQNRLPVAIAAMQEFSTAVNSSAEKENAFAFTYASALDYQNCLTGRTLFSALNSSELFTLPSQTRNQFEFHYVEIENMLAVYEDVLYAGIPNKARAQSAASQFLAWLFTVDTQRLLLEKARSLRVNESEFGIVGGFSAFMPVNTKVLPEYYPELRGRIPAAERIAAPAAMPIFWKNLKAKVLVPWLDQSAIATSSDSVNEALNKAFRDYLNVNPELSIDQ